jgi:hypothetical protein
VTRRRSSSGRFYDWETIINQLRARPGVWLVRLPDRPARLVRSIQEKSAPELHITDGTIEAQIVNEYTDAKGTRRGDVYVRYIPH